MKNRFALLALAAGLVLSVSVTGARAADEKAVVPPPVAPPPKVVAKPAAPKPAAAQLSTEAQYSQWLVQVLALSRFVPATPSPQECFAVLLLNGVSPKNGWNATSVVSRATLARTVVQAMGRQAEVQNPENDASWIDYLKKIGIEISTLGAALDLLEPIDEPLGPGALVATTDPLKKSSKIGPLDQSQMGADLSEIRTVLGQLEEAPPAPRPPPAPGPKPRPDPMTPS